MKSLFHCEQDSRKPFLIFLFLYLFYCVATYGHFGVTWDEFETYINGGLWIKYYLGQSQIFFDPDRLGDIRSHNYLNVLFIRLLSFSKTIIPDRIHLVNMILALPLFWFSYDLLRTNFKSWRWGLMGPLFLFLTPRILGDIPANPKDIPFAVVYFMGLYVIAMRKTWFRQVWPQWILLGFVFGFIASYRIVGLDLFFIYFVYRIYEKIYFENESSTGSPARWLFKEASGLLVMVVVSQLFLILSWPYIGKDYFPGVLDVIKAPSYFNWDKPILFMGNWFRPFQKFIWYYLPVWILIVTPIFILFFFFFSLFRSRVNFKSKIYFLMFLSLAINLVLYVGFKPEIYNGLRHYLFLLPIISFLACIGIADFFNSSFWKKARVFVAAIVLLNAGLVVADMVKLYPYDYVYFNELIGGLKGANGRFETDYWGASLREATEWLRDNEVAKLKGNYKVKMTGDPWQQQIYFSPAMTGTTKNDEDYRLYLNGVADDNIPVSGEIIHRVEREGVPLSFVVKVKK